MRLAIICVVSMIAGPVNAAMQQPEPARVASAATYADLADFALASKVTAHVRIKTSKPLKADMAVGVRPGYERHLVTADVINLIRAPENMPATLRYIIDLPLDSRGKAPRLKKSESILFALPGRPGKFAWSHQTPQSLGQKKAPAPSAPY